MLPFICYLDIQLEKQQTETQLSFSVHCKSHLTESCFLNFQQSSSQFWLTQSAHIDRCKSRKNVAHSLDLSHTFSQPSAVCSRKCLRQFNFLLCHFSLAYVVASSKTYHLMGRTLLFAEICKNMEQFWNCIKSLKRCYDKRNG